MSPLMGRIIGEEEEESVETGRSFWKDGWIFYLTTRTRVEKGKVGLKEIMCGFGKQEKEDSIKQKKPMC